MTSRRVFLGSIGSAAALGVGSAALVRTNAQSVASDDVLSEIQAQMRAHVRALGKDPKGEHLRSLAGTLRLLAIHQISSGMDARVTAALRARIRRDGEAEILAAEPHWDEIRAQAQQLGLTIPIQSSFPSYSRRKQVLDRLAQNGFAAEFLQVSAALHAAAERADRRRSAVTLVALQDECTELCEYLQYFEWLMATACLFSWLCPSCCFSATMAWLAWSVTAWVVGCRC